MHLYQPIKTLGVACISHWCGPRYSECIHHLTEHTHGCVMKNIFVLRCVSMNNNNNNNSLYYSQVTMLDQHLSRRTAPHSLGQDWTNSIINFNLWTSSRHEGEQARQVCRSKVTSFTSYCLYCSTWTIVIDNSQKRLHVNSGLHIKIYLWQRSSTYTVWQHRIHKPCTEDPTDITIGAVK